MANRSAVTTQTAASRTITSRARYLGHFVAWVIVHSMSAAGRAMCCIPEGESPVSRPRWWRTEARSGLEALERYLARR